jgi:acetolactate synthase-1/2/3 large subunit
MGKVNGTQLMVRALKAEGVTHLFGQAGVGIFPVFDACLSENLRIVDVRHETAGVFMTGATAHITGAPGVCLVTEGPGHANAISGLTTLYAEDTPVILISGCAETANWGRGAIQEIPQVEMAAPVAKWAAMVPHVRRLPEMVAMAWRIAGSGQPSPVHLTVPIDAFDQEVEEDTVPTYAPARLRPTGRSAAEPALIQEAVNCLAQAERAVIIAGIGARWSRAGDALQGFIEHTHIPLFTVELARGIVSDAHPLCLGSGAAAANPTASKLREADAVLVLGERLDFRFAFGDALGSRAHLIHVYPEAREIGRNRPVHVGIVADSASVVEHLLEAAQGRTWEPRPWLQELREDREKHLAQFDAIASSDQAPLHPLRVAKEVNALLRDDDIVILDGADFSAWARLVLPAHRSGYQLTHGRLGMIGTGVPYGVAAKLARPEARVIVFVGDGSLGFHFMEFDTAIRHNLPIVVVVGNDAAWGVEQHFQRALYGEDRLVATSLRRTRYDQMGLWCMNHQLHLKTCPDPACSTLTKKGSQIGTFS